MNFDEKQPTKTKWLLAVMVALAFPVAVVWWPGCRTYPPVSSKESLSLLRLLNTACNTRDLKLVGKAESQYAKLKAAGKLGDQEAESFEKILGLAMTERWAEAEAAAFKMAQDQVGVGHPVAHGHEHEPVGRQKK